MPPGSGELEEYPKASANADPWQVQPGVERDLEPGFGYLRQFFLLDFPLAKPPEEPQGVKQEERTVLEVPLCFCAQSGLGCSPAWAFWHEIVMLCSLVSFLPAFDMLNMVIMVFCFGRLTVFLRNKIFQTSVLMSVEDKADTQDL